MGSFQHNPFDTLSSRSCLYPQEEEEKNGIHMTVVKWQLHSNDESNLVQLSSALSTKNDMPPLVATLNV